MKVMVILFVVGAWKKLETIRKNRDHQDCSTPECPSRSQQSWRPEKTCCYLDSNERLTRSIIIKLPALFGPVSWDCRVQSCCRSVLTSHPSLARPCVGVHKSTLLMSLSLLLQQWPTCPACLIWMVFEMGGRCPYSCFFVGYCLQDFCEIAVKLSFNTLSQRLWGASIQQ